MQRVINNKAHLRQRVTQFESIGKSSATDKTSSVSEKKKKKEHEYKIQMLHVTYPECSI